MIFMIIWAWIDALFFVVITISGVGFGEVSNSSPGEKILTVGVIVIYRLLEQKEKFVEIDYELFKLLALHSASAIIGAGLFSQTGGIAASLREYKRL